MNASLDSHAHDRELIRSVLVVGGSSAAWMTACYLKKAFPSLELTLLEAPENATFEPVQGTGPNFQRQFFEPLGVAEDAWMRECGASFKVATKFANWATPRSETPDDYYYQLFDAIPECDNLPLSHYWLFNRLRGDRQAMAYACHKEPKVLDVKLAPRYRNGSRAMSYGWHVDTQLLSSFLKRLAASWGVRRIGEGLAQVELAADGAIQSLRTERGRRLTADLFIDCSGFRGLLIDQALREPFVDMKECLACDSVVWSSFGNDDALDGTDPYTSAIALNAGWAWKIPMLGRFASGYVYCSKFAGSAEAGRELCALWGLESTRQALSQAHFRVGRRRRSWVANCVSLGSSFGYLEPLEASNIDFTCAALEALVEHFPDRSFSKVLRDRFNLASETSFDKARNLAELHYLTSPRQDSPFWRANRRALPLSERLEQGPDTCGLEPRAGYHILSGMDLVPELPLPFVRYRPDLQAKAQQMFEQIRQRSDALYAELPTNYEFLRRLHTAG
ncbi:MAG TPA: tryptophan halogenase family protein [Polyangiaceae bacterium]|nr:tryptophan halogenase family protein [Polyangiaceae bacterium]